jgi:hypothetical protein
LKKWRENFTKKSATKTGKNGGKDGQKWRQKLENK